MSTAKRLKRLVKRRRIAAENIIRVDKNRFNSIAWQLIIEDFLTLRDLSSLDIAFCNHRLRPQFLSILPECVLGKNSPANFKYTINDSCLEWLHMRKITKIHAANFLIIAANSHPIQLLATFPLEWGYLRRFEYTDARRRYNHLLKDFSTVINHSRNLEEFSMHASNIESLNSLTINSLAECCPKLVKLKCTLDCSVETMMRLQKLAEQCCYLKELSIFMKKYSSTDESVILLLSHCRNLESFKFNYADGKGYVSHVMSDAVLASIATSCPQLQRINYQSDRLGPGMIKLAESCDLRSFQVTCFRGEGTNVITTEDFDLAMTALAQNCTQLEELSLVMRYSDCAPIISLAQSCENLMYVSLGSFVSEVWDALMGFGPACPQLRSLTLTSFSYLDKCLIEIVDSCDDLSILKLELCSLTEEALLYISNNCLTLREVEFKSLRSCESMVRVISDFGMNWEFLESFIFESYVYYPSDNGSISDWIPEWCIDNIAENSPNLRVLKWEVGKDIISRGSVAALGYYCRNLESLSLEGVASNAFCKFEAIFDANPNLNRITSSQKYHYINKLIYCR